jgi:hypothetical protein
VGGYVDGSLNSTQQKRAKAQPILHRSKIWSMGYLELSIIYSVQQKCVSELANIRQYPDRANIGSNLANWGKTTVRYVNVRDQILSQFKLETLFCVSA